MESYTSLTRSSRVEYTSSMASLSRGSHCLSAMIASKAQLMTDPTPPLRTQKLLGFLPDPERTGTAW